MVKDHLGNEYTSISEMCAKYGIKKSVYMERLMAGMTQEEIFTSSHSTSGFNDRNPALGVMADRIMQIRMNMNNGAGMSQKEFGQHLGEITGYGKEGLTLMMVSSVENARRCFDMDVYIALAMEQKLSLDYIFGRVNDKRPYAPIKGYTPYYNRVRALVNDDSEINDLKLRKRGTESRLALAEKFHVPMDYMCEITDETKMHE